MQLDALGRQVLEILEDTPRGLSEYELINRLRGDGHPVFQARLSGDHLSLFRVHFLLFHVLYSLRARLWRERRAVLEIGPLRIVLLPYTEDGGARREMERQDPLCAYYMDASHLENTTAEQVQNLLKGVWSEAGPPGGRRERALEVLELSDPVDDGAIRRQYRRLVMRHHPDRGGDKERLQAVNAAMEVLLPARG